MERPITEEKLYHQHLFRLDDSLNERLLNHMEQYGFSLSGIVRRSLQMFLEREAIKNHGEETTEKTTMDIK
jgi:hypothetical protein